MFFARQNHFRESQRSTRFTQNRRRVYPTSRPQKKRSRYNSGNNTTSFQLRNYYISLAMRVQIAQLKKQIQSAVGLHLWLVSWALFVDCELKMLEHHQMKDVLLFLRRAQAQLKLNFGFYSQAAPTAS